MSRPFYENAAIRTWDGSQWFGSAPMSFVTTPPPSFVAIQTTFPQVVVPANTTTKTHLDPKAFISFAAPPSGKVMIIVHQLTSWNAVPDANKTAAVWMEVRADSLLGTIVLPEQEMVCSQGDHQYECDASYMVSGLTPGRVYCAIWLSYNASTTVSYNGDYRAMLVRELG